MLQVNAQSQLTQGHTPTLLRKVLNSAANANELTIYVLSDDEIDPVSVKVAPNEKRAVELFFEEIKATQRVVNSTGVACLVNLVSGRKTIFTQRVTRSA